MSLICFDGCVSIPKKPFQSGDDSKDKTNYAEDLDSTVTSEKTAEADILVATKEGEPASQKGDSSTLLIDASDLEYFSVNLALYAGETFGIPSSGYDELSGTDNSIYRGTYTLFYSTFLERVLDDLENKEWIKQFYGYYNHDKEYERRLDLFLIETEPKYADSVQKHITDYFIDMPKGAGTWSLVRQSNYFAFFFVLGSGSEQDRQIHTLEQKFLDTASVFTLREKIDKGEKIGAADLKYYTVNLDYYVKKQYRKYWQEDDEFGPLAFNYMDNLQNVKADYIAQTGLSLLTSGVLGDLIGNYTEAQQEEVFTKVQDAFSSAYDEGCLNGMVFDGISVWERSAGFIPIMIWVIDDESHAQSVEAVCNEIFKMVLGEQYSERIKAVHISNYIAFIMSPDRNEPSVSTLIHRFYDSEPVFTLYDRMANGEHIIIIK